MLQTFHSDLPVTRHIKNMQFQTVAHFRWQVLQFIVPQRQNSKLWQIAWRQQRNIYAVLQIQYQHFYEKNVMYWVLTVNTSHVTHYITAFVCLYFRHLTKLHQISEIN